MTFRGRASCVACGRVCRVGNRGRLYFHACSGSRLRVGRHARRRDAPCPCGSARAFDVCHGRLATSQTTAG